MKYLVLVLALFLSACDTTPVVVSKPPVSCTKDLRAEDLNPCNTVVDLEDGANYSQILQKSAEYKASLKKCAIQNQLLINVAKACQNLAGQ